MQTSQQNKAKVQKSDSVMPKSTVAVNTNQGPTEIFDYAPSIESTDIVKISAKVSSVAGLTVAKYLPLVGSVHLPLINKLFLAEIFTMSVDSIEGA